MLALLSLRQPQISAHCQATYRLLAAYAATGAIELDPHVNEGAASVLLRMSDAMEALGLERWDEVDRDAVTQACRIACHEALLPFFTRTVLAFRLWLAATGQTTDAHLDELAAFAAELPPTDTMTGMPLHRADRATRRAARSDARRSRRRGWN